jgi:hypothetical protein
VAFCLFWFLPLWVSAILLFGYVAILWHTGHIGKPW